MKLLELFSGTRSVGKVAEQLGYEVVSLDLKDADINIDILNWDYHQYQPKHFDVIWASPPCTEYSRAKTVGKRDIEGANKLVLHCLEIIKHSKPKFYTIENPSTGLLKNQEFLKEIPYTIASYCKYSDWGYKKSTAFWNNFDLKLQECKYDCENIIKINGRWNHKSTAQKGTSANDKTCYSSKQLYRIPPKLCLAIYESILSFSHIV